MENKNIQYLVDVCAEGDLFLVRANTFHHKPIHRYTWARGDMCVTDYIHVDTRLLQEVKDAKVWW